MPSWLRVRYISLKREVGRRMEHSTADPVSVIKDFDAACNAHDLEGVMAFFTDDAVVRMEPLSPDESGGVYTGKEQIRAGFVEPLVAGVFVLLRGPQIKGEPKGGGGREK